MILELEIFVIWILPLLGILCFLLYVVHRKAPDQNAVFRKPEIHPMQYTKSALNPISIELHEGKSSLKEGAVLSVAALESSYLIACWGVDISSMYSFIYMSSDNLYYTITDHHLMMTHLQHICEDVDVVRLSLENGKNLRQEVKVKCETDLDSSAKKREKYPLVLLSVVDGLSSFVDKSPSAIMFQAIIIHLKDDVIPLHTHVIKHFVKSFDSAPVDLKKLFSSGIRNTEISTSTETDNDQSFATSSQNNWLDYENQSNDSICIICQVHEVGIAFIPCRHACVCNMCYDQVSSCPMCRGYIQSCINLKPVEEKEHTFYRLMDRLNHYLGLD